MSYGVLHELHKLCSEPKLELPPYLEDKQEVEAMFDLLKALALVADNPALPPPRFDEPRDVIVLGRAYAIFLDGIYTCRSIALLLMSKLPGILNGKCPGTCSDTPKAIPNVLGDLLSGHQKNPKRFPERPPDKSQAISRAGPG